MGATTVEPLRGLFPPEPPGVGPRCRVAAGPVEDPGVGVRGGEILNSSVGRLLFRPLEVERFAFRDCVLLCMMLELGDKYISMLGNIIYSGRVTFLLWGLREPRMYSCCL